MIGCENVNNIYMWPLLKYQMSFFLTKVQEYEFQLIQQCFVLTGGRNELLNLE